MRTEVEIQRQHDAAAHERSMRPAVASRAGAGVRGCLLRRRAWKFVCGVQIDNKMQVRAVYEKAEG